MKLVSEGTLEKVKHSFRLSLKPAAERKTPVQHEDVSPPEGDASSLQHQVRRAGGMTGSSVPATLTRTFQSIRKLVKIVSIFCHNHVAGISCVNSLWWKGSMIARLR